MEWIKIIQKVGITVSSGTGLVKAWHVYFDHFKEETWIRVIDAIIVGGFATVTGTLLTLSITFLWKKYKG